MRYIRRYKYIIIPIIFIFIYAIIKNKINIDVNLQNFNVISKISSILIIFLFIEIGMLLNLPKNKFTIAIKGTKTLKSTYITIFCSILFLFISTLGKLLIPYNFIVILFIIGSTNALLSIFDFFMIFYFTKKSK